MSDMMMPSYSAGAATHGSMFLAFGVLMPASIASARYLRRFPKTQPVRYWWGVHAILNLLIFGLFLVAWTVAVYIAGGAQFKNAHKKLGLAILVILMFQFFYGAALSALHAYGKATMRRDTPLDWIHWGLGYVILILGWVNVPLGMYRAADDYETSKAIHVLYFVWFGFTVAIMAGFELLYQKRGGNTVWAGSVADAAANEPQAPKSKEAAPLNGEL